MPASVIIENLSYSYEEKKSVLKNINLRINSGEKFGIIGPMGAGKSTLLLHLNGILSGNGKIEIDGVEVCKKNLSEIRERVGVVFQNPDDQLFNPTVEEDVAFGPLNFGFTKDQVEQMVAEALESMKLQGFEKRVSHNLSMGEKKRVAIATVLATKPDVIAFDEPFASLDPAMISQFVEIINKLSSTLVIISQSFLPLVACCDRIALLNHGEIAAVGPTLEILRNYKLLKDNGIDLSMYKNVCQLLFK
jgi:cobalt/nickel transport system ATP-binding protein